MERIGIAASKMAKDSLVLYNLYVILISFLVALLLFFIAGTAIFLGLLLIRFVLGWLLPAGEKQVWSMLYGVCMISLSAIVSLVAIFAVSRNIKLKK